MKETNIIIVDGELKQAYDNPAGYDLPSLKVVEVTDIETSYFSKLKIATGVKLEMPKNIFGIVKPRSGALPKNDIIVVNGVIDSDYRGEIFISVIAPDGATDSLVLDKDLPSIAQIVFFEKPQILFKKGKVANNTRRGSRGFGSSDELSSNT